MKSLANAKPLSAYWVSGILLGALILALCPDTAPKAAPAQGSDPQAAVDSVLVIPNPWSKSGRLHNPLSNINHERIMFAPVPPQAIIRIYSSAGNHIKTLRQNNPNSTSLFWNGRNDDNQYVMSDVYIYVVEAAVPAPVDGEPLRVAGTGYRHVGKFIVIR